MEDWLIGATTAQLNLSDFWRPLRLKLIKTGARVVRRARAITFQLSEVAVTGPVVRAIRAAINRLRAPPLCA